jgi:hypothetical protein
MRKECPMARRGLSSTLYRLARMSRDIEVVSSGNPKRIARRVKNKWLGRRMGRIWKWP